MERQVLSAVRGRREAFTRAREEHVVTTVASRQQNRQFLRSPQ